MRGDGSVRNARRGRAHQHLHIRVILLDDRLQRRFHVRADGRRSQRQAVVAVNRRLNPARPSERFIRPQKHRGNRQQILRNHLFDILIHRAILPFLLIGRRQRLCLWTPAGLCPAPAKGLRPSRHPFRDSVGDTFRQCPRVYPMNLRFKLSMGNPKSSGAEGFQRAIADFVCFHCPLVASAEAIPLQQYQSVTKGTPAYSPKNSFTHRSYAATGSAAAVIGRPTTM